MANPLQQAGAQADKPSKFAPIYTNQFWSGLWTNRSLLRDAATPFLIGKFYSGSRYESMVSGQNVEISQRLTAIRRPGNSVYNSNTFDPIDDFYAFHVFDTTSSTPVESIRIIADSPTAVYDITGGTQTVIFAKPGNAGQTFFQAVGNTLYMGNGVNQNKWTWYPNWIASNGYAVGTIITDSNGNLQQLVGASNCSISNVAIANNLLTLSVSGASLANGETFLLGGLTTATALNGQFITLLSSSSSILTATVDIQTYSSAPDNGTVYLISPFAAGVTGSSAPNWGTNIGDTTTDASALWLNKGPAVEDWGIVAPTSAPAVANVPNSGSFNAWVASTFYNPSLLMYDGVNLQLLTGAGTTNATVPVFSTVSGGTTTDGSATWTAQTGSGGHTAARQTNHSYVVGDFIRVAVTQTIKTPIINKDIQPGKSPVVGYTTEVVTTGTYFYKCTTAGGSNSSATGNLQWPAGLGATLQEPNESLVWTNVGPNITRIAGTTSAVAAIAGSTKVSLTTEIDDASGAGGGTGLFQNVTIAGLSGAAAPTWKTALGQTTADGSAVWSNGGPATAPNLSPWLYGYAFKNSVTGHVSSMSPASSAIILSASSYISVSGSGDPNFRTDGVDTIEIYRTTQGQSTFFYVNDIPAPLGGQPFSWIDTNPDPGIIINITTGLPDYVNSPLSTMNIFIEADVTGVNSPPPAGFLPQAYHLNRIFGNVSELVNYSSAPGASIGVGPESFPPIQFWQMSATATKLWPSTLGLMVFCVEGVFVSPGIDSNGLPLDPVPLLEDVGLLSANYFTVNGSTPTIYTSDQQTLTLDPSSGLSRIGFPIEDTLAATFTSTGGYMTWHTSGPDQALYIADGSTGWYRCAPVPAPESTGNTWSPKANIVGGVKCVKSIEVAPGIKRLLSGPAVSGPILQRDYTTYQDGGSSYPANFVVGNIVLAQPSQLAQVAYITTEAVAVGSRPAISVLIDEISGVFESIEQRENDPPGFPASLSLYADRWYFDQLQHTAQMRSMQVNFSWPAENAANELLTYTIVGQLLIEED